MQNTRIHPSKPLWNPRGPYGTPMEALNDSNNSSGSVFCWLPSSSEICMIRYLEAAKLDVVRYIEPAEQLYSSRRTSYNCFGHKYRQAYERTCQEKRFRKRYLISKSFIWQAKTVPPGWTKNENTYSLEPRLSHQAAPRGICGVSLE